MDLCLEELVVTGAVVAAGLVGLPVVPCGVVTATGLVVTFGLLTTRVVPRGLLVSRRSVVRLRVDVLLGATVVNLFVVTFG